MILTDKDKGYIEGYAAALQDLMYELTGENKCAKRYDPCEVDDKYIHSYAFDLKDGGRHHEISDYESRDEVIKYMLKEAVEWMKE